MKLPEGVGMGTFVVMPPYNERSVQNDGYGTWTKKFAAIDQKRNP